MSATSRSLKCVLREALAVSRRVMRRFSNRFSPHRFTQPQLFACLVLKEFLGQDYRTAARLLAEIHTLARAYGWSERDLLGMSAVRRAAYLGMVST